MTSAQAPHPREDVLLRFLRREATGAESRAVMRHLLTGCLECVAVTRPVWSFAAERVVKLRRLQSVAHPRPGEQAGDAGESRPRRSEESSR